MFWIKIRKIGLPQFYYIKVWFKGVYISQTCFPDGFSAGAWKIIFVTLYYSVFRSFPGSEATEARTVSSPMG